MNFKKEMPILYWLLRITYWLGGLSLIAFCIFLFTVNDAACNLMAVLYLIAIYKYFTEKGKIIT